MGYSVLPPDVGTSTDEPQLFHRTWLVNMMLAACSEQLMECFIMSCMDLMLEFPTKIVAESPQAK